jgi:hypothetical protein
MKPTPFRLAPVRQFDEPRPDGSTCVHVLAVCDTGTLRVLIDRVAGAPPRLLAILKEASGFEPGDEAPQIRALCSEYVRHYLAAGGPLCCRLTREHLEPEHRAQATAPTSAEPWPAPQAPPSGWGLPRAA